MKRLIVDMDDVIADATGQFINYYEKEFGVRVLRESLNHQDEGHGFPAHHDIIKQFPYREQFFRTMVPHVDSVEVLDEINKKYDVTLNGNGFVLKLDLVGPPEQLARIGKDVNPHFLLNIDDGNVSSSSPVQLKIEGLPDGVRLSGPPPETTFTATPRQ